jgi:hypothetical protein
MLDVEKFTFLKAQEAASAISFVFPTKCKGMRKDA